MDAGVQQRRVMPRDNAARSGDQSGGGEKFVRSLRLKIPCPHPRRVASLKVKRGWLFLEFLIRSAAN